MVISNATGLWLPLKNTLKHLKNGAVRCKVTFEPKFNPNKPIVWAALAELPGDRQQ